MATYVLLIKDFEDDEKVVYRFGPDKERMGKIQLNKSDGEYLEIEPVPETDTTFYFNRAVSKLLKHLKSGEGFPDRTHFAS
ncbi:MAG: hypothetical protein ACM3UZ_10260 [Acidobacteriota bacterium]